MDGYRSGTRRGGGVGVEKSASVTLEGSLSELKQSIGSVNVGKRLIPRGNQHFDIRRAYGQGVAQ